MALKGPSFTNLTMISSNAALEAVQIRILLGNLSVNIFIIPLIN